MKMKRVFSSSTTTTTTTNSGVLLIRMTLVLCWVGLAEIGVAQSQRNSKLITRDDFPLPPNFVFGSGTSAYQVEGAANEDGRTPSVWDTFAHSGYVLDKTNGDIACDHYHKYKEDVQLMVDTGFEAYRFSISWSRLIPNGRGPVNPKGLQFYNNLIDELISHGIQAHVTLIHYDLPQELEDEYEGWLSRKIVKDFTGYADVCFREFGDRVSSWTTVNEANVFVLGGYDVGIFPPRRCSSPFGFNCTSGNSTSEPYIAAHNVLLAHASVAKLYRQKYQAKHRGVIGLNVFAYGFIPQTNTTEDIIATQRANDFYVGWFLDPLVYGDYPEIMKKNVGSRIPSFTERESELLKGSCDFFGLNHYATLHVKDDHDSLNNNHRDFQADMAVEIMFSSDGKVIPDEFDVNPAGLQVVLEYFKQVYGNPPIYIHENGQKTASSLGLNDTTRVKYLEGYIGGLHDALRNGSNTKAYFTWSFLDAFELLDGYQSGFGMYYIDRNDPDLKRYPKLSAQWYASFLKGGSSISSNCGGSTNHGIIETEKIFSGLLGVYGAPAKGCVTPPIRGQPLPCGLVSDPAWVLWNRKEDQSVTCTTNYESSFGQRTLL